MIPIGARVKVAPGWLGEFAGLGKDGVIADMVDTDRGTVIGPAGPGSVNVEWDHLRFTPCWCPEIMLEQVPKEGEGADTQR